ncbi:ABC transporter ATP-binding protein [Spirochaeta isovalerica]|uniref:Peptide/nickel transport system ATP-binding protein n=1 Tax=Spirochaeta isovalerica TaxID=150 RepID=A0A841RF36_9SPIO|nr:ABC transporter ATP-binding protein [Spirochaeta isovalerica]MBB6481610.1 peptide/nickel transport system ATP-binding protein [Spirochaeta isovalerica]
MSKLLEVKNLSVDYITLNGAVRAVDDVSFSIEEEQSMGLAGESGCGKSTIAYSLMRLHRPPALIADGSIELAGRDIIKMKEEELRQFRWEQISMVFQSAMNCLNPVVKLDRQFYEIYKNHGITQNRHEARAKAEELIEIVGIPRDRLGDYPHQFSGGMRQRAVIAMALALKPKLLIMDEPTTALDTVVQREILQRVYELKKELKFSILFITHDLSLMMEFCDDVSIMYAGKIVEQAPSQTILNHPQHPYSYGLKNSFPSLHGDIEYMEGIPGSPLNMSKIPPGCRFQDRCFRAQDICFKEVPPRKHMGNDFYDCHNPMGTLTGSKN